MQICSINREEHYEVNTKKKSQFLIKLQFIFLLFSTLQVSFGCQQFHEMEFIYSEEQLKLTSSVCVSVYLPGRCTDPR